MIRGRGGGRVAVAISLLAAAMILAGGVPLAGLTASRGAPARLPSDPPVRPAAAPTPLSAPTGAYFDYIVIILLENHNLCDVYYGNATGSPCGTNATGRGAYETGLSNNYSIPLNYRYCNVNPSLPNYLCLTAASTFGCTVDGLPNSTACTRAAWNATNIVDRMVDAGLTWKAYMENMTTNCQGTNAGSYAVKHDPFVFYRDIAKNATRCSRVIPAGANDTALLGDLNSTSTASNYMWLTPNLKNDAHDTNVTFADAYLGKLVPKILASPVFTSERAAVFIAYDEGYSHPTYATWAGPVIKRWYASTATYTHFSLLSTIEANWHLPPLNANDTNAANMSEFFVRLPPLTAAFTTSPTAPIAGQAVRFTANVTGGTPPYAEAWSFGDGATGTGADINHTYASAGTYTVNLTVTDAASRSASASKALVVGSPPPPPPPPLIANFTFSPATPMVGESITFNASASGGVPPYTYAWTFGDGQGGSGSAVSHSYSSAGTYSVNLTVTDSNASTAKMSKQIAVSPTPLIASFTFTPGNPFNGQPVSFTGNASGGTPPYSYAWTFGDGTTGTGAAVTHAFAQPGTYTVTLAVTDAGAQSANATKTVTVVTPPQPAADFTYSPANPLTAESINFTAYASGGTPPYAYAWSFGDGATGTGATATHSYATAGNYTVTLTVTDSALQVATASHAVPVAAPLVVGFTTSPTNPIAGETINFTASASGGTPPYSFTWTFGDGSTGTGASATHAYAQPGTYAVTLAVSDAATQSSSAHATLTVNAPPPPPGSPAARFTTSPVWPQANATVAFNASASTDPNPGATMQFRWDWTDDGTWDTSWSSSPVAGSAYASSGIFTARLEVLDSFGMTDNTTRSVVVDGLPPVTSASLTGSVGSGGWYLGAVTITLSASDSLSGVASTAFSLDGGGWQAYAAPFLVGSDGSHSVAYGSTDRAGNVETVRTTSFRIDGTPPVTSATYSGAVNGSRFVSPIQVNLTATDAGSGVAVTRYQLDGGPWVNYTAPFVVDDHGTHEVAYGSVDVAGNAESTHTFVVVNGTIAGVPGLASAAQLQGSPGSAGWYTSAVTVTLVLVNGTSPPDTIGYRIDSGPWTVYAGPFAIQGDGVHELDFNASNNAGIVEATHHMTVGIDTTPPTTTAAATGTLGANGWYISDATVSLAASDATSGVGNVTFRVDGGPWQTYTSSVVLLDGVHALDYYATDHAGNAEPVSTVIISVDTTPPTAAAVVTGSAGNAGWFVSNVTVALNASDATSGVAAILWRLDGGAWQTYAGTFVLQEGRHILDFYATDMAGNAGTVQSLDVNVDLTPPSTSTVTAGTHGTNGWYVSNASVTLNASDATSGVASIAWRVDGGPWHTYTGAITLAEGRHVLEFLATDVAGNAEAVQTLSLNVDTTPPSASASSAGAVGANGWYVSNVTVSLNATDATSGVAAITYRIDGGSWQTYAGGIVLREGRHVLEFYATDLAGNAGAVQSLAVNVDTTPPTTSAAAAGAQGSNGWYVSNVTVTLSANDTTSGVGRITYRIDGGAWQTYGGTLLLGEGRHVLEFFATDAAGNAESVQSMTIDVDVTPPSASAAAAGTQGVNGWYVSNVTVTLNASDATSGVGNVTYRIDGGPWASYTGPFLLAEGRHVVEFTATDVAGLSGPIQSMTVWIDTAPPQSSASASGTSGSGTWYVSNVTLTIAALDATSGVLETQYRIDGGAWQPYLGPFLLGEGRHTIEFFSTDAAGLREPTRSTEVDIDLTLPATAYTLSGTVGNGGWYLSDVTVALQAADAGSGVASTNWSVDGGPWTPYASPFSMLGGGRHLLRFASVDGAGNREAAHVVEVDIEDSAPSFVSLTGPTNTTNTSVSITWSAAQDDSPIVGYEVSVDGGAFVSVGMTAEVHLNLSAGTHTIWVRAKDAAGLSAVGSWSVTVQPSSSGGTSPPVTPEPPAVPWFASGRFFVAIVIGSLAAGLFAVLFWEWRSRSRPRASSPPRKRTRPK